MEAPFKASGLFSESNGYMKCQRIASQACCSGGYRLLYWQCTLANVVEVDEGVSRAHRVATLLDILYVFN